MEEHIGEVFDGVVSGITAWGMYVELPNTVEGLVHISNMDDDYYQFTIEHSLLTDEIRHADSAALVALKTRAYLNLIQDKQNGKHVNSKDIRKHRSDVLKNVVIMTEDEIPAPSSIVKCVKEFVMSIRSNWEELANPLAKSLDQTPEFVEALLEQLENLFVIRS